MRSMLADCDGCMLSLCYYMTQQLPLCMCISVDCCTLACRMPLTAGQVASMRHAWRRWCQCGARCKASEDLGVKLIADAANDETVRGGRPTHKQALSNRGSIGVSSHRMNAPRTVTASGAA